MLMRSAPSRLRQGLAIGLLVLGAGGAHAGLFDDEEARKAILDLRARIQASDDASKARTAELATSINAQLLDELQKLRRSLLDLNAQLETQRAETARLRGTQEQLARDLAEVQRRQKDVAQGLDERFRKLEPQKVTLDGVEFSVDPEERRQHDEAMATLRSGDFAKAGAQLAAFLKRYPGSGYAASARFWLGNAQYGKRDYKEAIASFRAFLAESPEHARAPEALLSVANCQIEMKDPKAARRTLDEVIKTYPKSEAAEAARERLPTVKG
ncbi:tol-pal system protein YbgF [Ideonella sp. A 288]|uniref:tol-pal system protein YbgF n=1 Tax=Ideonella sp. A 288 TaxID=1962181 RepID=UPI0028732AEA|nr:tol-pal system protein YbgF [Ideonella sp. A 288]